ncbi:hypothetical protein KKA01_01255 [Patescibacteria group bacterium]|nr:hypothetical protein [Patescibacteria group bacterium]
MNSKYLSILVILIVVISLLVYIFASGNGREESMNANTTKAIPDRLKLACEVDSDCRSYVSTNTCEALCANTKDINAIYVANFRPSCDPTVWDPEFIECGCVNSICQEVASNN